MLGSLRQQAGRAMFSQHPIIKLDRQLQPVGEFADTSERGREVFIDVGTEDVEMESQRVSQLDSIAGHRR